MVNITWQETIYSSGTDEFILPCNPRFGKEITFRIKVFKENPIVSIFLCFAPDGEELTVEMQKNEGEGFFTYYSVQYRIKTKILSYRFMILTRDTQYWYNAGGLVNFLPNDQKNFKLILDFDDPEWVKKSVFYQIFPDRFFDGNPMNNVQSGEYSYRGRTSKSRNWGELPHASSSSYSHVDFYGGDLEGILQKIPYLLSLGINALYLNPIFTSQSNHKYDTVNYKEIDPHFGGEEAFISLIHALHDQGIRIILDGVFNHTGNEHQWFKTAQAENESKYVDFYTFYEHPDNYLSWFGHKSLPKLNYHSSDLCDEIYRSDDSIIQYWLKEPYNIDGWRIDVANMLARQDDYEIFKQIWEEFRKSAKGVNTSCYLLGEHFFDPSPLLNGTRLDAVMNYRGFYQPVLKWLLQIEEIGVVSKGKFYRQQLETDFTTDMLNQQMFEFRSLLPFQLQLLQFNLLTSHDIPRFNTLANNNLKKIQMGLVFLFTYIGVPSIYYGDEIGLEGGRDPDCRRCMIWDEGKWNKALHDLYRRLIQIRKFATALEKGSFRTIYLSEDLLCFVREYRDEVVITILNNGSASKLVNIPFWKIGLMNINLYALLNSSVVQISEGILSLQIPEHSSEIYSTNQELRDIHLV
ncbi:MAG: maltodextrin glucosidase [Candidatus Hodarchaeales archaeon]|jgi:alpha-glucosidase